MLTIRDARPEDRPAIRALTLAAYGEYADVMEPDAWAALEAALLVALDVEQGVERIVATLDGAVVGSVLLFAPAADAYGGLTAEAAVPELRLLAVAPAGRGRGVGEALVRECVRRARSAGAHELGLHTSRSMRPAIRLYTRLGFTRAPERDFQPPGAELVEGYRLPLGDAQGFRSPRSP